MSYREYYKYKQILEQCFNIPFQFLINTNINVLPSLITLELPEEEFKISSYTAILKYGKTTWTITKYKYKLFSLCTELGKSGIQIESFRLLGNLFSVKREQIEEIMYEILEKIGLKNVADAFLFFRISEYSFYGAKKYEEKFFISINKTTSSCCTCFSTDRKILKSYYVICKSTHILLYDYKNTNKIEKIFYYKQGFDFRIIRGALSTSVVIIDGGNKYTLTSLLKNRVENLYEEMENSMKIHNELYNPDFFNFAPIRHNNLFNFFVDGKDYYEDLYYTIKKAKNEIYLAGWWIFPKLFLKRTKLGKKIKKKYRLDNILKKAAERGVKIYILIYQEVQFTVSINSGYTYDVFSRLHPNISVLRHPYNTPNNFIFWSHHEKMVVVDQKIAFVGGIDLCLGRYDTKDHLLFEKSSTSMNNTSEKNNEISNEIYNKPPTKNKAKIEGTIWPGMDFSNPLKGDFKAIERAEKSLIDREKIPRMPWHDIQCKIIGGSAFDISLHFIQRWNYSTSSDLIIPNETYFSEKRMDNFPYVPCQTLRSIGKWSTNEPNEHSIYDKYIEVIRNSTDFLYIENQFFITSCFEDGSNPENLIGLEIVNRIINAHKEKKPFKVYIVIPLVPAFELDISLEANSVLMHILKIQSECIIKKEFSFINVLKREGIDYNDYVMFLSLQKYQKNDTEVHSEQIYVHSKLLIADGTKMILGSANINDRSMLGDRDTELGLYIEDTKFNQINDLLRKLIKEHMGYKTLKREYKDLYKTLKSPVLKLESDFLFNKIKKMALNNTKLYSLMFSNFLNDEMSSFRAYNEAQNKPNPITNEKLDLIIGNFVFYPFKFLIEEDLESGFLSLNSIIPKVIYY